jgi:hypothetical protein
LVLKLKKNFSLKKNVQNDSDHEDANNNHRARSKTPLQNLTNALFKSPRKITSSNSDDDKEMEEIYENQMPVTPKNVPKRAETPVLQLPRAMSPVK